MVMSHISPRRERAIAARAHLDHTEPFEGLFWSTEGRFFTLSGRRYAFLVVGWTKAECMSNQKKRKTGQMMLDGREVLL